MAVKTITIDLEATVRVGRDVLDAVDAQVARRRREHARAVKV
jgi:hypothetical protein